jgi:hypothetical protein
MKRACFRVNYFLGGQPASAFIVAGTDTEASAFLGVQDGSAQVSKVAYPVEVVGLDTAHALIPPTPVTVAPFDIPRTVSRSEFDSLQAELADLKKQLAPAK